MRIIRLLIATLSLTLSLSPASAEEIAAVIQKYLEGGADKEAAWKTIETYDFKPEKIEEMTKVILALVRKGKTHAGGTGATEIAYREVDGKDYTSKYYAYFTGDAKGGNKYPLFVILHSGGGKRDHGASALNELSWWPRQKDAIVTAPVCRIDFSANVHWNSRPNFNLVPAVIEEMIRSYPVDTNRVYVLGASMGGWGAWSHGSLHADRFAAAVSHSGGTWLKPNPFPLENMRNLPIYIHHGGNENPPWETPPGPKPAIDLLESWKKSNGGYEVEAVNIEGQGHCNSTPEQRVKMMKWLLERKRDPCPKKIVWKLTDASNPQFYWLKITPAKNGPSFVAECKENRIEIASNNFKTGLTVYLNSALVDMNKPVTVVLDGEQKFSGIVKPSLAALVETLRSRLDPALAFWGKVQF